jgi:hypothetical protein
MGQLTELPHTINEHTPCIRFDQAFPTLQDSDVYSRVMVYKPQGWPEFLAPQYPGCSPPILAADGYWSKVRWDHYQGCSYDQKNWRKRILHSHWKAKDYDPDTYIFTYEDSVNPDYSGLEWDTYDWSEVREIVSSANDLILLGKFADRTTVQSLHKQIIQKIGKDDQFWNRWYDAIRRFEWTLPQC